MSGAHVVRIGDEGAWQSPCFDVVGIAESKAEVFCIVKADGTSGLQCCCWGVVGDRSVGAVQWLRVCVCIGVVACDCVSLEACGRDGGSMLLLWLSRDSWAIVSWGREGS